MIRRLFFAHSRWKRRNFTLLRCCLAAGASSARSQRCAKPARHATISFSAESTRAGSRRRDQEGRPLQGEHRPELAGFRLCDGPPRGRLARRQEHPAGVGHPAERAHRAEHRAIRDRSCRPRRGLRRHKRGDAYLKMYGNICYDTRDHYVNFPWSSERK